ncbi:MAG: SpoIIE family protein phosphatase [Pseudomonadota bacterium]
MTSDVASDAMVDTRVIRRVLVVDDSRAQLRLTATVLKRLDFEVLTAESGAAALEVLDAHSVDLILSDWMMPEMSGLDLCRAFRARSSKRYVYFILLTSKTGRGDVAEGLEAGADDFLSKPVNPEELRARIAAGERLVAIQRELENRNKALGETLDVLQSLYDAIAKDLVEARRLQQSLVPSQSTVLPGGKVSYLLEPCGHIGGDLVGSFYIREGTICVYSIDVAGHGVASALMTARLASYLSNNSREQNVAIRKTEDGSFEVLQPAEVCAQLNSLILGDLETELYFTMAIAVINPKTGDMTLAQAGHPHPMILRHDGTTETVGGGGFPIGLIDGAQYDQVSERLHPGDRLIMYSDGFTEQTSDGETMLDEDGLATVLTDSAAERGNAFIGALTQALSDFAKGKDFDDDISAIVFDFDAP